MAICKDCFHWDVCKAMLEVAGGIRIADDFKGSADRCKEFVSAADVAPRAEWISVEERLPDGNGRFLTVDEKGDMMVCYWEKRFGWFASVCNKNAITHWIPLPEPPKANP